MKGTGMDKLKLAFVSFGFLGCAPIAPGTFGTLGGVLLAFLFAQTSHFLLFSLVACAVLYVIGRALGDWSETYAGKKDPGIFVVDEVIGYLVTVLWVGTPTLLTMAVAFFVFRFFDIFKPPPARRLERLGGGDGIILDDVVAGLYGLVAMLLLRMFLLEPSDWILV